MPSLPSYVSLEQSGLSQQDSPVMERSDMDSGPAKTRRIQSDPVVTSTGSLFFENRAAIADFRAWFYSNAGANGGAGWLDWTDPRTSEVRQIRFVSLGALTPLAGQWAVALQAVVFEYVERFN